MKLTRVFRNSIGAAVIAGALMFAPAANARVFVSVGIAPPAIPVYVQPPCPGYGYIWTPGYWAYGPSGYYWIDGAWVLPPYEDALWTPGYWGFDDDAYFWNPGYWGLNVGYYGGINYGFGYFGTGFYGGYWRDHHFYYNGEYNRFGFRGHDSYVYHQRVGHYDGRPGGLAFARYDARRGNTGFRGSGINGRTYNRDQAGFRNGYMANGSRPNSISAQRGNTQSFGSGYTAQRGRGFGGGNSQAYRGSYSGVQPSRTYQSGNAGQFRGGSNTYSSPQARGYSGNSSMQSRSYSAPAQARGYSGGNYSGGGRASFGGASAGGGSFHGGGGGGGFHGGGGGGGFHGGGGGGGSHGGGGRR